MGTSRIPSIILLLILCNPGASCKKQSSTILSSSDWRQFSEFHDMQYRIFEQVQLHPDTVSVTEFVLAACNQREETDALPLSRMPGLYVYADINAWRKGCAPELTQVSMYSRMILSNGKVKYAIMRFNGYGALVTPNEFADICGGYHDRQLVFISATRTKSENANTKKFPENQN